MQKKPGISLAVFITKLNRRIFCMQPCTGMNSVLLACVGRD